MVAIRLTGDCQLTLLVLNTMVMAKLQMLVELDGETQETVHVPE